MRPRLALFAAIVCFMPSLASAQVLDRIEVPSQAAISDMGVASDVLGDVDLIGADTALPGAIAGAMKPTNVAAVRDRRGRVIVRGPRGRAFMYRGRRFDGYRGARFVYPRGFRYRRWGVGQLLPAALIAAPFFFAEYRALGLEPPPPGYRWVRYGPDVVLVNVRTREIEDVAYGAIYEDD